MPYKITQERSTTSLNAIATHSTQGLNQLQGSQAIFRAPKPTHGSQAHPLENTNLESTTARKLKKWLASRKPSSSRVATYHSSKRSPPSPDPHVVTLILSMILNIPISTHQASHTKAYRKNSRYTQGVLAYTQKKKKVVVLGIPVCILPLLIYQPKTCACILPMPHRFRIPSSFPVLLFPGSRLFPDPGSFSSRLLPDS
jgi:hypothetical protein